MVKRGNASTIAFSAAGGNLLNKFETRGDESLKFDFAGSSDPRVCLSLALLPRVAPSAQGYRLFAAMKNAARGRERDKKITNALRGRRAVAIYIYMSALLTITR